MHMHAYHMLSTYWKEEAPQTAGSSAVAFCSYVPSLKLGSTKELSTRPKLIEFNYNEHESRLLKYYNSDESNNLIHCKA